MAKTLPKGHLSCLSNAFRYTPAARTDVANTFARITRQLETPRSPSRVESFPIRQDRRRTASA
jgi:hypothetical protein